jgi:uncharacterized protein (TIGR03067 family)
MRLSLLFAVMLIAAPVFAAAQDEELQKLQGVWIPVSYEAAGKTETLPAVTSVIIRDATWIFRTPAGDTAMLISVDGRRSPKQIDENAGPAAIQGIYKLEGDTLTVSVPVLLNGKFINKRPAAFATKAGQGFGTYVYQRDASAAVPAPPKWASDWSAAFSAAKNESELVLVDYYATWCKPCDYMDGTVLQLPDVAERLNEFVLLRLDVDKGNVAYKHHVGAMPSYVIYDPSEHERFRLTGTKTPEEFRRALDAVRNNAGAILKTSELLEQKKDIEAGLLLGNTYSRIGMMVEARDAYRDAKAAAVKEGQAAGAQMADALSAFTFARQGNPQRAIKLLEPLGAAPVDHDTEALIFLTLGNAQRLANDMSAARSAYERALAAARPGSAIHNEITAAIAELKLQ